MGSFDIYILKSVLWLTGFALVYLLFLQNERYFMLKRLYLVSGIIISVLFPFLSIHYRVDIPAPETGLIPSGIPVDITEMESARDGFFNLRLVLMIIYISGVLFLTIRILRHAGTLLRIIRREENGENGSVQVIKTSVFPVSFSFFNYVFIKPSADEEEMREIMNHELVHIEQKHWFDLLLAELLRIVQWINPFVWIYTGFIRQNHEYLADQAALRKTKNPANYRAALLNQVMGTPVLSLVHTFNYAVNKKRFEMMKKIVISPYRKMKVLFVLPVFAIIFYAFAEPEYNYVSTVNGEISGSIAEKINTGDITGTIVDEESKSFAGNITGAVSYEELKSIAGYVTGMVLDEEGNPLPGVSIVITGSYTGTVTDASGRFSLGDVPENSYLVFSQAGYRTQAVKAQFKGEMKVSLLTDPNAPSPPAEYLRIGSEETGEDPLIIVDGVTREQGIQDIDPSQIESVTVLKDAQATARYGDKGKNGVILITTKRGTTEVTNQLNTGSAVIRNATTGKVITGTEGKTEEQEPFVVVEEMPRYIGGEIELLKFINDNVQYPEEAKKEGIQGRVIIRFVVTAEGGVDQIDVIRGVHPLLDAEAVRVIGLLGKFEPGRQGGIALPVWYSVPVTFSLQ